MFKSRHFSQIKKSGYIPIWQTPVIVIKIFANEESLKGDRPIATPIPIEIKVFVSIKTRILIYLNLSSTTILNKLIVYQDKID